MAGNVTNIETLKQYIRDRARETWDARGIPYYLSFVATDLKKLGVDYRSYIGPLKLSQWASSTEFPDTRFVAHPHHKAKVGFIPADINFSFSDDERPEKVEARPNRVNKPGRALLQFVESLADVPEEALGEFQVPAKVLIALWRS